MIPRPLCAVAAIAATAMLTAGAPAAAAPDAAALLRKYDAAMGAENFEAHLEMVAHREDGSARTYVMRVLKGGESRARIWFSAPVSVRGQEMLRQGDNVWVYMPNVRRALRLGARDAFQGGDFNNGDVLRVDYAADYAAHAEDDPHAPGVVCLDLTARSSHTPYERIKLWVHHDDALPIRAEYYSGSGKLLRRAEYADYRVFGGLKRPARVTMHNMLAPKRFSTMRVLDLDPHVVPTSAQFVLDNLGR